MSERQWKSDRPHLQRLARLPQLRTAQRRCHHRGFTRARATPLPGLRQQRRHRAPGPGHREACEEQSQEVALPTARIPRIERRFHLSPRVSWMPSSRPCTTATWTSRRRRWSQGATSGASASAGAINPDGARCSAAISTPRRRLCPLMQKPPVITRPRCTGNVRKAEMWIADHNRENAVYQALASTTTRPSRAVSSPSARQPPPPLRTSPCAR